MSPSEDLFREWWAACKKPQRRQVPSLWVYARHLRNRARDQSRKLRWLLFLTDHAVWGSRTERGRNADAWGIGHHAGRLFAIREEAYNTRPHSPLRPRHSIEGRSKRPLLPAMIPLWGRDKPAGPVGGG